MNKTVGLLAHVDAGKTTFSEQLLYHTNSIRNRGRVDHQDTFLDSHRMERQRGITIFADQGRFSFNNTNYYLIDTPGHVDFSPEMERAIQVMDYAIIIISAVEGVEGHTETVWNLLQKHQVPTFFFINKVDRVGADISRVMQEIRESLTENSYDFTTAFINREMDNGLIEFLAEREENLLEAFMESGYKQDLWTEKLKSMIAKCQVYPCMYGSALQDEGIQEFLDNFDFLTETHYDNHDEFSARVYKIKYDKSGTRITFIKILQGTLQVRDQISYEVDGDEIEEKVNQLRVYNGNSYQPVQLAQSGEIVAVIGLSQAPIGLGLGALKGKSTFEMVPTLKSKVIYDNDIQTKEVFQRLRTLDAEEPSLQVEWDEIFQEIYVRVMGVIQLEILQEVMKERFGIAIGFGEPEILYKETVSNTVKGYGHFEPLRHYAEVHLEIEPGDRNSGISFENECHANDLSVGNQNLIRHHVFERDHHGLLTGSPLTDVKVTLLTGRAHNKHTSGGDFREATFRALRQGLEKADNVLLEPIYHFKIKVHIEQMGKVLSDIQQAHGAFHPPEMKDDIAVITGKVPVATFMNYSTEFASFTHGKGVMNLTFGGYEICHNQTEVIKKHGYNKDADPLYTSSSIFCAKGQGYKVPWEEAENHMHAL